MLLWAEEADSVETPWRSTQNIPKLSTNRKRLSLYSPLPENPGQNWPTLWAVPSKLLRAEWKGRPALRWNAGGTDTGPHIHQRRESDTWMRGCAIEFIKLLVCVCLYEHKAYSALQIGCVSLMTPPQKKFDRGLPILKTILEIYTALPVMSCVAERNSSKLSIRKNFLSINNHITKALL